MAVPAVNGAPAGPKYTAAISVDVRPAVDDLGSMWDRLARAPERLLKSWRTPKFRGEGLDPAHAPKEAAALGMLHSSNTLSGDGGAAAVLAAAVSAPLDHHHHSAAAKVDAGGDGEAVWGVVDSKCGKLLDTLKRAGTEEDRKSAHLALNYCMASVVCPSQAAAFMSALETGAPGAEAAAFSAMASCVVDAASKRGGARPLA